MTLSEDFLYKLKQGNPIDSVMSSYSNLKKRGRNYTCLCPFHSEKTPSCTVYTDSDSFFCYGCGAGGDVITFIRKAENLDYIESVKFLAERSGIAMPEDSKNNEAALVKMKVLEINRAAAKFFFGNLNINDKKGLRYLLERGLTKNTVVKYGIGFALDNWNSLKTYMVGQKYSEDELVNAGVCARSKSGNVYDVFRNRVMFPIIDLRGNVVAFGGRLLDGEGAKYLNTSDTAVFKKSRNLFSLNIAKNFLSKDKRIILAEGYMDVVSINQAGFENVVATLGTALTTEQARLISQYATEVIIAYDSDEAGQAATHKAINLLGEVGVNTKIIRLSDSKDPDEYIKKHGAIRFKLLLDNSEGAILFELEKCRAGLDLDSDVSRVEFLKRTLRVLSDISSPIERDVYISKISHENNVSKDVLVAQVKSIISKRIKSSELKDWENTRKTITAQDKTNPEAEHFPLESKAETGIIAYLYNHTDKLELITNQIPPDRFVTSFNKKVYQSFISGIKNSLNFTLSIISDEFTVDEMGKISEILAKNKNINIDEKTVLDYMGVLIKYQNSLSTSEPSEMSNDDFLNFTKDLKNKCT